MVGSPPAMLFQHQIRITVFSLSEAKRYVLAFIILFVGQMFTNCIPRYFLPRAVQVLCDSSSRPENYSTPQLSLENEIPERNKFE